jgi:ABC-type transport system substrate-binding protein
MNRQEYIAIVGGGTIGAPFLPDSHFYLSSEEQLQVPGYRVDANGEKLQEDIDAAKALLAEAGYPDGFETTLDAATIPTFVTIGQVVADQMKRYLNIDVKIKSPTYAAAQQNDWKTGNFDMISFGTSFLLVDPDFINASLYLPGGERNRWGGGWRDEKVIDLSGRITAEGDPSKRRELTIELGTYLEEMVPHISLAWGSGVHISNNKIKNYHPPTASNASVWHEHVWFEDNYTVIGDRP